MFILVWLHLPLLPHGSGMLPQELRWQSCASPSLGRWSTTRPSRTRRGPTRWRRRCRRATGGRRAWWGRSAGPTRTAPAVRTPARGSSSPTLAPPATPTPSGRSSSSPLWRRRTAHEVHPWLCGIRLIWFINIGLWSKCHRKMGEIWGGLYCCVV